MSGGLVTGTKSDLSEVAFQLEGKSLPAFNPSMLQSELLKAERPLLKFETVSLRDAVASMPVEDQEKIKKILAEDPRLSRHREGELTYNKELVDLSPEHAARLTASLSKGLAPESQRIIGQFIDFYCGYLRAFPNPSETEPVANLFNYLTDPKKNWTAIMAVNDQGKVIASCSGEIITAKSDTEEMLVAMNEHTWVDSTYRGQNLGGSISEKFSQHCQKLGAVGEMIEVEIPFLLTKDPRAFSMEDPKARAKFWTSPEPEGLGWPIDPFSRMSFWGKLGFGVLCGGDPPSPIPYVGISMELGKVECCDVLSFCFKPYGDDFNPVISKTLYKSMLVAFQETIDPNATLYPELVRVLKEVDEKFPDQLYIVGFKDPNINEILMRSVEPRSNCVQEDIQHCVTRLADPTITATEQDILEKSLLCLTKQIET